MRPVKTSLPVVTMPIFLRTNGYTCKIDSLPSRNRFASSNCHASNNNGIHRMPATGCPAFTGVPCKRVTMVNSPILLMLCNPSTSTVNTPS